MRRRTKVIIASVVAVVGLPVLLLVVVRIALAVLDQTNGELISSGVTRDYLLHVPESYDPSQPVPLVVSLHGAAMWPAQQMNMSRWNRVADENGFLVVYPGGRSTPRAWHGASASVDADVRFIADLIEDLSRSYRIDPARVYADGLSNGGRMAWMLSCRLADEIAAVGTIAAANELPWEECGDAPPVPAMLFHGTDDPVVPYGGGTSWVSPIPFPAVEEWAAKWAARNECSPSPRETVPVPDVSRREYVDCAGDASVILYTLRGAGHTWPGGKPLPEWLAGPNTNSVNATAELWAFFNAHRLSGMTGSSGEGMREGAGNVR